MQTARRSVTPVRRERLHRSLHNAVQPKAFAGFSIAIVNSVGNLGGFAGPFVLGTVHDAVGNICGETTQQCTAQWGYGTSLVGGAFALSTLGTSYAWRRAASSNLMEGMGR